MTATHPRQAVKNLLRLTAKHEITLEKNQGQSRMSSWRGRTLEEEKMGTKRREPSNEEQTGDGRQERNGEGLTGTTIPNTTRRDRRLPRSPTTLSVSQRIAFGVFRADCSTVDLCAGWLMDSEVFHPPQRCLSFTSRTKSNATVTAERAWQYVKPRRGTEAARAMGQANEDKIPKSTRKHPGNMTKTQPFRRIANCKRKGGIYGKATKGPENLREPAQNKIRDATNTHTHTLMHAAHDQHQANKKQSVKCSKERRQNLDAKILVGS